MSNNFDLKYIIFDELIIILINSLSYYIYEGIYSINSENMKISNKENNLKNFQMLMEDISNWNSKIIDSEVNRIKNKNKYNVDLQNLLESCIKAYINLFTYYDPNKYKNKITIDKFIHNCYIECSKEFYFNPYLFYYECDYYQIKKNQLESISIINKSIKNVLRQSIQLNFIIDDYLNNNNNNNNNNISKNNYQQIQKNIIENTSKSNIEVIKQLSKNEENSKKQIKNIKNNIKNKGDDITSEYLLDGTNHLEKYNDIKSYK